MWPVTIHKLMLGKLKWNGNNSAEDKSVFLTVEIKFGYQSGQDLKWNHETSALLTPNGIQSCPSLPAILLGWKLIVLN